MSYRTVLAVLVACLLIACEDEGPAERAGARIDDALEGARDRFEDARDEAQDLLEDARERLEEE